MLGIVIAVLIFVGAVALIISAIASGGAEIMKRNIEKMEDAGAIGYLQDLFENAQELASNIDAETVAEIVSSVASIANNLL